MHKVFNQIGEALSHSHFKGAGRHLHRERGDWVILLELESAEQGDGFTVTLGLHPLLPEVKKIHHRDYKLDNCPERITIGDDHDNPVWPLHLDSDGIAALVGKVLSVTNTIKP